MSSVKHTVELYNYYLSCAVVLFTLCAKAAGVHYVDNFTRLLYGTTRNGGEHYGKGVGDIYFVFFMINVINAVKFMCKYTILQPLARLMHMKEGLAGKFVCAGWCSCYYIVSTSWGYFIFRDDAWWFSTRHLWDGYPHNVGFDMKSFYLISLAFWVHSLLSFPFEPPRRDDFAMIFHHLLTIALVLTSYLAGFTRVGAAILMEQNAADIFYYLSKQFKYARLELLSTVGWITFALVWFWTRHIIFGSILYSLWWETEIYIPHAWDAERDYYFNGPAHTGFFIALLLLQGLMVFWFAMILKVAFKVITGRGEMMDTTEYSDGEEAQKTD